MLKPAIVNAVRDGKDYVIQSDWQPWLVGERCVNRSYVVAARVRQVLSVPLFVCQHLDAAHGLGGGDVKLLVMTRDPRPTDYIVWPYGGSQAEAAVYWYHAGCPGGEYAARDLGRYRRVPGVAWTGMFRVVCALPKAPRRAVLCYVPYRDLGSLADDDLPRYGWRFSSRDGLMAYRCYDDLTDDMRWRVATMVATDYTCGERRGMVVVHGGYWGPFLSAECGV